LASIIFVKRVLRLRVYSLSAKAGEEEKRMRKEKRKIFIPSL
jgi:hypothetical protein